MKSYASCKLTKMVKLVLSRWRATNRTGERATYGEELDGDEHLVIYDEQVLLLIMYFQNNSKCNKEEQRIFLSVHCAGDFTIILFLLKWLFYLVLFVTLLFDNQLKCDELPVTLCVQGVLALILSSNRVPSLFNHTVYICPTHITHSS